MAGAVGFDFQMQFLPGEQGEVFKVNLYDHGCGIAVGDYDSDGDDDVFFLNQLGPNALYANDGHGRFRRDQQAGKTLATKEPALWQLFIDWYNHDLSADICNEPRYFTLENFYYLEEIINRQAASQAAVKGSDDDDATSDNGSEDVEEDEDDYEFASDEEDDIAKREKTLFYVKNNKVLVNRINITHLSPPPPPPLYEDEEYI